MLSVSGSESFAAYIVCFYNSSRTYILSSSTRTYEPIADLLLKHRQHFMTEWDAAAVVVGCVRMRSLQEPMDSGE